MNKTITFLGSVVKTTQRLAKDDSGNVQIQIILEVEMNPNDEPTPNAALPSQLAGVIGKAVTVQISSKQLEFAFQEN